MATIEGLNTAAGPVEWLDRVLQAAMERGWSDLQFRIVREPDITALGQGGEKSQLVLRARVNRRMQDVALLVGRNAEVVVVRIKANARVGTGPAIEPLDGLYQYVGEGSAGQPGQVLDIRVSVYPTYAGETIQMRLPSTEGILTMDELCFTAHNRELINRALSVPNGLTLVAGPMGSGKSTSLRTFLKELGGADQSVWAVEDPVELRIDNVEQISINAEGGNTWQKVLTGLRRSDLEVLMIGEIRNFDQASAALEIGNAGAKVISSIHANDSVGAVMQLMELSDAQPHTLGNQLRTVISQRLLRRLCPTCAGTPDAKTACQMCEGSGFKGVRPIHEVLILSEEFISALAAKAPAAQLRAIARKDGMKTLRETAQEVLDAGETSLEEVWRVLGNE